MCPLQVDPRSVWLELWEADYHSHDWIKATQHVNAENEVSLPLPWRSWGWVPLLTSVLSSTGLGSNYEDQLKMNGCICPFKHLLILFYEPISVLGSEGRGWLCLEQWGKRCQDRQGQNLGSGYVISSAKLQKDIRMTKSVRDGGGIFLFYWVWPDRSLM